MKCKHRALKFNRVIQDPEGNYFWDMTCAKCNKHMIKTSKEMNDNWKRI